MSSFMSVRDAVFPKSRSGFEPVLYCSYRLTPLKYPRYLDHTLYGKLVSEQRQRFQNTQGAKAQSCYFEYLLDLRIPEKWDTGHASKNLRLSFNGLDVAYVGPGRHDTHAALVKTDFPMKSQCGVFYYEIKIISKGEDGFIGIGFCSEANDLERLPGWDPDSYGYHGDDGYSFAGSGTGKPYGPCFTTGDVIGCGVNFADHSSFYTKNGQFLGTAFTNINLSKPIYPSVGLRTSGEQITTNFGDAPFVFDIQHYIHDQKAKALETTTLLSPHLSLCEQEFNHKKTLHQLILSYLTHHEYSGTAKAIVQNSNYVNGEHVLLPAGIDTDAPDFRQRQLIRSAITQGQIDEAIKLIDTYFPGLFEEKSRGEEIQVKLKCHKFVEMMRVYYSRVKSNKRPRTYSMDTESHPFTETYLPTIDYASIPDYAPIPVDLMVVATYPKDHSYKDNAWSKRRGRTNVYSNQQANHLLQSAYKENGAAAHYLKLAMEYGQQLQEEYRQSICHETRLAMLEVFSLLAYSNPKSSAAARLLKTSRRDALATEVNTAILVFQKIPLVSALERVYSHAITCNDTLSREGLGKAAFMNLEEYLKHH